MANMPRLFEMRRTEALSNTIFGVAMTLLAYRHCERSEAIHLDAQGMKKRGPLCTRWRCYVNYRRHRPEAVVAASADPQRFSREFSPLNALWQPARVYLPRRATGSRRGTA